MSWQQAQRFDAYGPRRDLESSPLRVPRDILRQHADEFLGPERSFESLDPWNQETLLQEIEADILELDLRLEIVTNHEPDTY